MNKWWETHDTPDSTLDTGEKLRVARVLAWLAWPRGDCDWDVEECRCTVHGRCTVSSVGLLGGTLLAHGTGRSVFYVLQKCIQNSPEK